MHLTSDHFYWMDRKKYQQLIKDFLDQKVSAIEFDEKFRTLWCLNCGQYSKWEKNFKIDPSNNFEPDSRAAGFEELVSLIYTACDVFNPNEDRLSYHLDEEGLKAEVGDIFPKVEKYCN